VTGRSRLSRSVQRFALCGSAAVWGLGVAATRLDAQGAVRGQLRVVETAIGAPAILSDAVIYLEADGERPRGPIVAMAKASVGMRLREFVPRVQTIGIGGAVSFPNQDPFSHNVFSNSALGAFDLGLYRTGKNRAATFPKPGVYAIYCNIHARMVSYVVAVPTPYVARAQSSGVFTLAGVPAGRWRLHVWHERAPEHVETITVPTGGLADIVVALDGRGYVPKPHTNKFGQPYATSRADRY
jgi:plastocyanin